MSYILICSELSTPCEMHLRALMQRIAGSNHYRFFTHPLRDVPLPLLPDPQEPLAEALCDGREDEFFSSRGSVLHCRSLLDCWIDACNAHAAVESPNAGEPVRITVVVSAIKFKSYERWATSRGFSVQDLVSNGRTLAEQRHSLASDIDLALQHLGRESRPIGDVIVGIVNSTDPWFARHPPTSVSSAILNHLKSLSTRRQEQDNNAAKVVTAAHSDSCASSLAYIPAGKLDLFMHGVDKQKQGDFNALGTTLSSAVAALFPTEDIVITTATDAFPGANEEALSPLEQYFSRWMLSSPGEAKWKSIAKDSIDNASQERPGVLETRSFARVGLMGNPSDQFHGKSMAVSISNFWADVFLYPSSTIRILPSPVMDPNDFGNLRDLFVLSSSDGYSGGMRLVQAICKRFFQYCVENNVLSKDEITTKGFTLCYNTNVPRQVGLAGSSCIVTATLKALMLYFNVTDRIPKHVLPSIALSAEIDELGIHAGLMDRVIQMYDGLVLMDFTDKEAMTRNGFAVYEELDPSLLPQLHLAYAIDPSDSGKKHNTVKQRYLNGDPEVHNASKTWASLVDELVSSLRDGSVHKKLGELMDRNFDLRRRLYQDASLGWKNLRMVEIARAHGANAKFPGSGGAILIYCDPDVVDIRRLQKAMYAEGFVLVSLIAHERSKALGGAQ